MAEGGDQPRVTIGTSELGKSLPDAVTRNREKFENGNMGPLRTARREVIGFLTRTDLPPHLQSIVSKISREAFFLPSFWKNYVDERSSLAEAFNIPNSSPEGSNPQLLEQYNQHPLKDNLIAASLLSAEKLTQATETNRQLADQYIELAKGQYIDPVTGLRNQKFFKEKLPSLVEEYQKDGPVGAIRIDADRFKEYNDRLGSHEETDRKILAPLGLKLQFLFRPEDIVMRSGGDEFFILLPGVDEETCLKIAARIQEAINTLPGLPPKADGTGATAHATASIGVAIGRGKGFSELDEECERATYFVKANGRNNIKLYNEELKTMNMAPLPREE